MDASTTLSIPRTYGFIVLVAVMNWFILMWQAFKLVKARKQYNIQYPTLYEAKDDSKFNCVQRAHQSSLEWNTAFITFLFVSGLCTPLLSTAAGVLYNIGRVYHAHGYYNGSAHKGLWGLYGLFYLIGGSVYTALQILRA